MMTFVLQALDGIFTIVFVVGIGYVLSKKAGLMIKAVL